MKNVKRTLAMMMAGLMAVGGTTVWAESGGGEVGGTYEVKELEDASFTFYQFSVENHDNYQKMIDKYNESHPNIKINLESAGGGADWRASLKAKIAGGEEPALIMVEGPSDFSDFGSLLTDLSDEPWVDSMYDSSKEEVTIDGKIVACPTAIVDYGLVYNKRIFEAAGIDASALTSYEAIDSAFADLKEKIDNGELAEEFPLLEAVCELPAKETWVLVNHGANIALGNEFASANEAYAAQELEFKYADAFKDYLDLMIKYTTNAENPAALNAVDYATALGGGLAIERVAVIQMGQWIIPELEAVDEELSKEVGVLPMPLKGVKEDGICYGGASYLIVNQHCTEAEQAAAKDFLNFMFTSDVGKDTQINVMNNNLPFKNMEDYPVQNVIAAEGNEYAAEGKTTPLVFGGYPSGWMDAFGAEVQSYIAGTKTWEEVVESGKAAWAELR